MLGVSTILILSGCSSKQTEPFVNVDFAMGTVINQMIYSKDDITNEVLDILTNIEDNMLSWRIDSSEIAKINTMAGEGVVSVSQEVKDDIETAIKIGYDSDGALDITIGKVSRLWNIEGENPSIPEDSTVS